MKIVVREIRTFLVTRTTEDGTEISDNAATKAVLNGVLEGSGGVWTCKEVEEAPDLTMWKVEVGQKHVVDV
jgi:hypothetical protein